MLQGRRAFWGYQCVWEGNYMLKSPDRERYGVQLAAVMDKAGDKKVFFSSMANKLNTKGKDDSRVIVVTEKHIYKVGAAIRPAGPD